MDFVSLFKWLTIHRTSNLWQGRLPALDMRHCYKDCSELVTICSIPLFTKPSLSVSIDTEDLAGQIVGLRRRNECISLVGVQ